MMVSNPKSIQFLTGNQIARSTNQSISASMQHLASPGKAIQLHPPPIVYDKKTGTYTNYNEMNKTQLTASESLGIGSGFQQVRI